MPAREYAALPLIALLAVVWWVPSAQASCVGPGLKITPTQASAGDTITLSGSRFGTECNDTGDVPAEQVLGPPATGITVTLQQDSWEWVVAQGDAQDDLTFTVNVTIPSDVTPGTVSVVTEPPSYPDGPPWEVHYGVPPMFTVVEREGTGTKPATATATATAISSPTIATFPNQVTSPPSTNDTSDRGDSFDPVPWALLTASLASVTGLILLARTWRRRPRN